MAERVARQTIVERAVARQTRWKRKVGKQPEAKLCVTAAMAPTGRQEALVLMSMVAATVVPTSHPGVEIMGSSGRPIPGVSS